MTLALSNYLEQSFLNHALRGINLPATSATRHLSLHSADPSDTGANEVTLTYFASRTSVASSLWVAPATSGTRRFCTTNNTLALGTAISAGSNILWWGLWDAASGGNFLLGGKFVDNLGVDNPLSFGNGDTPTIATGGITIGLDIISYSIYLRDLQLNWLLRNIAAPNATANKFCGLFTSLAPDGTGTEVTITIQPSGRVVLNSAGWATPIVDGDGYQTQNTNAVDFGTAANPVTGLTNLGVYDALTGGNLFFVFTRTPVNIVAGDPVFIAAGGLKVKIQ